MLGNFNGAEGVQSWTDYTLSARGLMEPPPSPADQEAGIVVTNDCSAAATQVFKPLAGAFPSLVGSVANPGLCLGQGGQDPK